MAPRDNIVMSRKATPKRITLPNKRTFIAQYQRERRDELPKNVILRRKYKRRVASKTKRRKVAVRREKGIGSTFDKILKNPIVRRLVRETLKRAPDT